MKLGAQFYTLRNLTKNPDGIEFCFAQMKKIGYDVAQMSAIGKIDAERLKEISDKYEMPITCTHSPFDRIVNDTDALIAEHKTYGCPVIGLGSMPQEYQKSLEGARAFLKAIDTPMKKMADAGLRFAYHNHFFEFAPVDGVKIYDLMIEEAPLLNFIPDLYWLVYSGEDPVRYLSLLGKDRITNVHFKDMKSLPQGPICPCGEGVIDFAPIVRLCDSLGIPYGLVEQDNAPDLGDEIAQMKTSFDNLKPMFD